MSARPLAAMLGLLHRLALSERGAAAVEFALILPVLLFIYVGTLEASALISMDRKVQSVSGAIGDLVARSEVSLTSSQMRDYFRAAGGIMTPYSSAPVEQVVTAISVSSDGETSVLWSRQYHGGEYEDGVFVEGTYEVGEEYSPGDSYPLPEEMIAIALDSTVIAAQASYSYTPLFGIVIDQAVNLHRSSYFMPRFGGSIALN
ncbi:MAG: pilus assembly protein [Devosia sp.]|uniref:TadE/TadG family type IV pilus assembly protein n=1 Tax=Devosia sp. TaxID=1871048 RepID=UPI0024C77543|nr:TadE/TadG family type IV pilus assembly protein [Devosia sp.]UYN99333.1 MAG: pilus assembly protein [Devosia sp.]